MLKIFSILNYYLGRFKGLTPWCPYNINSVVRSHIIWNIGLPYRTNWVHMCWDDLGNTPCEEIPHHNTPIITAHCKQCSSLVECTCYCQRYTIQSTIKFLMKREINIMYLTKQSRYKKFSFWFIESKFEMSFSKNALQRGMILTSDLQCKHAS